jgi:prepilin-type N-terminal cleavage/methylation domain-containing protein
MALFKKGFSLVELVVVLAVIGLIAAIAVPSFSTVRTNAARSAAEATARNIGANALALATQADTDASVAGVKGNGQVEPEEWYHGLSVSLAEAGYPGLTPGELEFSFTHANGQPVTIAATTNGDGKVVGFDASAGDAGGGGLIGVSLDVPAGGGIMVDMCDQFGFTSITGTSFVGSGSAGDWTVGAGAGDPVCNLFVNAPQDGSGFPTSITVTVFDDGDNNVEIVFNAVNV